jgi:UDP-N-acetylglucosamine diphosphorylase/glucosamine-1-phosphate N-acetyltransferase
MKMAKKLFIFEDDKFDRFFPLTLNRPVYELLWGMNRIREKIVSFVPNADVILLCRDYLEKVLKETAGKKVNYFRVDDDDDIILVNGRLIHSSDFSALLDSTKENTLFLSSEEIVAWQGRGKAFKNLLPTFRHLYQKDKMAQLKSEIEQVEVKAKLVGYLWDLVTGNPGEIEADFVKIKPALDFKNMFKHCQIDDQALMYDVEKIFIGRETKIDGHVVLDARTGPIFIEENVQIQSLTRVEGPCYIGQGTILVGGKLRSGTSIGPHCRMGGEVEQSIFLGYSNKYHEGFLGHSYVGEWVNLGALTTNSDLKNNYGSIKVMVKGKLVDSGQTKIGAFIGDHAKTGIGTLLNTGVSLGFASNVFGGGMVEKKLVPPFFWGGAEGGETYRMDKAIQTAKIVLKRRNKELSSAEEDLFKKLFQLTENEREK